MIDMKRELFHLFGRLDTWIVGIQYHDPGQPTSPSA